MGWAVCYDHDRKRDVGYGIPCRCEHPECNRRIDRGLAHACGGEHGGGERGCGLYFCGHHLMADGHVCERCAKRRKPFAEKPDMKTWMQHKLRDPSWQQWRDENPAEVATIKKQLAEKSAA
jgi:hypothetical protein